MGSSESYETHKGVLMAQQHSRGVQETTGDVGFHGELFAIGIIYYSDFSRFFVCTW